MATNFSVTPTWVYPQEPQYHNIVSETEGLRKVYFNVSGSSIAVYRLIFDSISDAQHTTLRNHYNETLGGYTPFTWNSVPAYISSVSAMYGRWISGTFREKPNARSWDCEIDFEVDNG